MLQGSPIHIHNIHCFFALFSASFARQIESLESLFILNISSWTDSRLFSCSGDEIKRLQFSNGGNYCVALRVGSFEIFGDRVTKLGTNMWVQSIMFPFFCFILITLQRNAKCIQINCLLRCIGNNSLKVISLKCEIDSLVNNEHLFIWSMLAPFGPETNTRRWWLQIFIDSGKFTLKFSRLGCSFKPWFPTCLLSWESFQKLWTFFNLFFLQLSRDGPFLVVSSLCMFSRLWYVWLVEQPFQCLFSLDALTSVFLCASFIFFYFIFILFLNLHHVTFFS